MRATPQWEQQLDESYRIGIVIMLKDQYKSMIELRTFRSRPCLLSS